MYTITGRVGASQTDGEGRMKLVSAVDFIQDCSQFWMESEPYFESFMRENQLGMFLLFRQVDVVRLPAFGEEIKATTSIYGCQSFYGYRNTVLYGQNGAPDVLTWSIGVFVNGSTGRMARLPADISERVKLDPKLDMTYTDRRITLPGLPAVQRAPVPVRRVDIDLNRHMNNARYLDAAVELLPEGFAPNRIRVEYRLPAQPGATLFPQVMDGGEKQYVLLNNGDGKPYTVMEFCG